MSKRTSVPQKREEYSPLAESHPFFRFVCVRKLSPAYLINMVAAYSVVNQVLQTVTLTTPSLSVPILPKPEIRRGSVVAQQSRLVELPKTLDEDVITTPWNEASSITAIKLRGL